MTVMDTCPVDNERKTEGGKNRAKETYGYRKDEYWEFCVEKQSNL